MSSFKTKKEKHDAMQTAYWLDEDLNYHEPAALRASAETLLDALYGLRMARRKAKDFARGKNEGTLATSL